MEGPCDQSFLALEDLCARIHKEISSEICMKALYTRLYYICVRILSVYDLCAGPRERICMENTQDPLPRPQHKDFVQKISKESLY